VAPSLPELRLTQTHGMAEGGATRSQAGGQGTTRAVVCGNTSGQTHGCHESPLQMSLGVLQRLRRALLLVTILLFGIVLAIGAWPAGPDMSTSTALGGWIEVARIAARGYLGPLQLGPSSLESARCSSDGASALLTFVAPLTHERFYQLVEFENPPESSATMRLVAADFPTPGYSAAACVGVPQAPSSFHN
jgi:hypothetical protein